MFTEEEDPYEGEKVCCYYSATDVPGTNWSLITLDYFQVDLFERMEIDEHWSEIAKNWLIMGIHEPTSILPS